MMEFTNGLKPSSRNFRTFAIKKDRLRLPKFVRQLFANGPWMWSMSPVATDTATSTYDDDTEENRKAKRFSVQHNFQDETFYNQYEIIFSYIRVCVYIIVCTVHIVVT